MRNTEAALWKASTKGPVSVKVVPGLVGYWDLGESAIIGGTQRQLVLARHRSSIDCRGLMFRHLFQCSLVLQPILKCRVDK